MSDILLNIPFNRDFAEIYSRGELLSEKDEKFRLENFAPFVNESNIQDIFNELSDAIYHIERNGNAKLILTDLSIKLTRLLHKK
jgi:hypothetical protein